MTDMREYPIEQAVIESGRLVNTLIALVRKDAGQLETEVVQAVFEGIGYLEDLNIAIARGYAQAAAMQEKAQAGTTQ